MLSPPWDRARVAALAAGTTVYLRDQLSRDLPVPDWLLATGARAGTDRVQDRVRARHPDDRRAMVDLAQTAHDRPGELIEMRGRARDGDGWVWERVQALNLREYPDMGGVLLLCKRMEPVEAADLPAVPPSISEYFEPASWVVVVLDGRGEVTSAEGMVSAVLGFEPHELIDHSVLDFIHVDDQGSALEAWIAFLTDRSHPQTGRQRLIRADQSMVCVESTLMNRPGHGSTDDLVLIWHDITKQLEQEATLVKFGEDFRLLADEFRLVAEQVPAAVFRADQDGAITFRNSRWDGLVQPPMSNLFDVADPAGRLLLEAEMQRLLVEGSNHDDCSLEVTSRDEQAMLSIALRCVGDEGSARRAFVGSVTDVSNMASLRHLAERDPLTGLLNRRAIEEHLALVTRDGDAEAVVVFIDLDGFKGVNDKFGHDAGDAVLVEIARRLEQAVRPDDAVGRYGGDEFVVVCPRPRPGAEHAIEQRIEFAFAKQIEWDGGCWMPAASIGTTRSQPPEPIEAVVRRADHAMFTIKRKNHLRNAAASTREPTDSGSASA